MTATCVPPVRVAHVVNTSPAWRWDPDRCWGPSTRLRGNVCLWKALILLPGFSGVSVLLTCSFFNIFAVLSQTLFQLAIRNISENKRQWQLCFLKTLNKNDSGSSISKNGTCVHGQNHFTNWKIMCTRTKTYMVVFT